ncbi:MAG: IS21-like element helper ATPase IstB [Candidatus Latescibacterota bacterium]
MLSSELKPSLARCLKELHLPTVRACYGQEADRARQESLPYEHYLAEVMEREREVRRHNRVQRLLGESKLPLEKSLETFETGRLSSMLTSQLSALLEGSFVERSENVLAFGNPGSGKTHLLCALAQELIHRQGRRLLFTRCSLLVQQLLVAKRDLKLPRLLKALSKYEVILIDEIGYVEQNREEMEVLFILLAERYERGSLMITSNLPFSKWERIFKDPMTTAAAIDRLVHHSIILELNLPSYRLEHSTANREARPEV